MMRVDKPNGDFFYAVPFDTDEVAYLVKIDVKIDNGATEEDDKDYYDDEIKAPTSFRRRRRRRRFGGAVRRDVDI